MKKYELHGGFSLDHLQLADRPIPVPGPHEALIRIRAVSLNYRDLGVISGFYAPDLPLPFTPVSDGVGEVVEVGANVTRF
ncbi:alcohol dehydrogenase catalytic domain-containing protein [Paenibacillus methanolicus]|uniref:Alcohol dehydrogenase-like protein n=1 Tax=Paenibacillus methanolicus TaxID=582686 RepID=A0A5S5CIK4_9BACL|nr:alcohol dehydrogenase catalytic domain-containing protein [Paenibacillus methanolicus]TYP79626.1 alcohol dehydrogenase-like protein [Paenibacillus methanolicus]